MAFTGLLGFSVSALTTIFGPASYAGFAPPTVAEADARSFAIATFAVSWAVVVVIGFVLSRLRKSASLVSALSLLLITFISFAILAPRYSTDREMFTISIPDGKSGYVSHWRPSAPPTLEASAYMQEKGYKNPITLLSSAEFGSSDRIWGVEAVAEISEKVKREYLLCIGLTVFAIGIASWAFFPTWLTRADKPS